MTNINYRRIATIEFTVDGHNLSFMGKPIDETPMAYLIDSPTYGTYWQPKSNCKIVELYEQIT